MERVIYVSIYVSMYIYLCRSFQLFYLIILIIK